LRFAPGFGPRIIGVPAHEFIDGRTPLADVWSARDIRRVHEQLAEASDPGAALEAVALGRWDASDVDATLIAHVVQRARAGEPVSAIADGVGVSTRQLQRRCTDAFGYGAKTLTRILRMVQALEVARSGAPLAETAARAGYADQAHLSREVKELAGVSLRHLVSPQVNGA
jgi:AraC-like DNA-binding protein